MLKALTPADRLIVAADFEPDEETGIEGVRQKVAQLAEDLAELGVYLKIESILRAMGYDFIPHIHQYGLRAFADLKLNGIPQTLAHDGMLLKPYKPELVTAMCSAGKVGMAALKAALPESELLGVTFLTSMDSKDAQRLFGSPDEEDAVLKFAFEAKDAGFDGLISAPGELSILRSEFGDRFSYNTPNIRPGALAVVGDDQNRKRSMTPTAAIKAGADRLVVGRPITQAANRRDATMRILDEIAAAA